MKRKGEFAGKGEKENIIKYVKPKSKTRTHLWTFRRDSGLNVSNSFVTRDLDGERYDPLRERGCFATGTCDGHGDGVGHGHWSEIEKG